MVNETRRFDASRPALSCGEANVLLSGYLDGELTQQQAQRVRLHIETCVHCQQLHSDLSQLKARMQQLSWPQSDEDMLDAIGKDFTAHTAAVIGWGLLLLGLLIFLGFMVYAVFTAEDDVGMLLFFYGLLIVGGLGLFVSVLRQRLMTYKNDRYRKVKL